MVNKKLKGTMASRRSLAHRPKRVLWSALALLVTLATVCMALAGKKTALMKTFQKPTGALTVSLEYARDEGSDYTENDLIVLSMQVQCSVDDGIVN